ncbi:YheO-like PAS domain protein [Vagococcus humatus]|uniref:YheO-like PAS domain protein n=2 Tax=Vagococcus humatus TaxID=1889241 RepID=A0A429Z9E0_9ENTE|nr:YheO-like PAS domain protein [Vagococcus humatus]
MLIYKITNGDKKMSHEQVFSYYKGLVPFLHQVLGPNSEVLLHDIRQPDSSIVALAGNLSQRSIGGPLTDMALKQIQSKKYETDPAETNYPSYTVDGKMCRSSSYYIKNEQDELIGLLCINVLVSDLMNMRQMIDDMICLSTEEMENTLNISHKGEKLGQNLDELMKSLIDEVLEHYDLTHCLLSIEEKEKIISDLNEKGVFLLKGGVAEVAKRIDMSESSVYRYLSKIK